MSTASDAWVPRPPQPASLVEALPPIYPSLLEARSFSCLMGNLPLQFSPAISALQSRVHPQDLLHSTFEDGEQPHVTVLYGLHTRDPREVYSTLKKFHAIRPATLEFGSLGLFRHRDQDVLKIGIQSPDLEHLYTVASSLPNSFAFPEYNPHVTVAYLKPGTGEKYLQTPNPLIGRQLTLGGLVFSDPNHKISYLPLKAPQIEDILELAVTWGFPEDQLIEMTTAMAVGTLDRPFGWTRPIFPSRNPLKKPMKRSVDGREGQAKGSRFGAVLEALKPLLEGETDPPRGRDDPDYTGIPYHLRVMDVVEGDGWEHTHDLPQHSVFTHEMHPGVQIHVRRANIPPIWSVIEGRSWRHGNDIDPLVKIMGEFPFEDKEFEE